MGTENFILYLKRYKLSLPTAVAKSMKQYPEIYLDSFINKQNKQLVSDEALDLLLRMLIFDKNQRITPIDAMQHPYFFPIKKMLNI
jgi:casein kinase II subunit alpha